MKKSEKVLAFETAMKESKELREKYAAVQKRIIDNREVSNAGELLVKAAAEVGFDLDMAELERAMAAAQEVDDDELEDVSGGVFNARPMEDEHICWNNYYCYIFLNHDDKNDPDHAFRGNYNNFFMDAIEKVAETVAPVAETIVDILF